MPKIFWFQFWFCSFWGRCPNEIGISLKFQVKPFFLDKHLRCPKFAFNSGFSYDFVHFGAGAQMRQNFLWSFGLNLFSSLSICDVQNLCSILVSVMILFILGQVHKMRQDFCWNFRLNLFSSISICDAQNLHSIPVSVLIVFIWGKTPYWTSLSFHFQVKPFFPR